MGTTLNRRAYEELISEDIAWLEKQPHCLERDHIANVLLASADHEYSDLQQALAAERERADKLEADGTEVVHNLHCKLDAAIERAERAEDDARGYQSDFLEEGTRAEKWKARAEKAEKTVRAVAAANELLSARGDAPVSEIIVRALERAEAAEAEVERLRGTLDIVVGFRGAEQARIAKALGILEGAPCEFDGASPAAVARTIAALKGEATP